MSVVRPESKQTTTTYIRLRNKRYLMVLPYNEDIAANEAVENLARAAYPEQLKNAQATIQWTDGKVSKLYGELIPRLEALFK